MNMFIDRLLEHWDGFVYTRVSGVLERVYGKNKPNWIDWNWIHSALESSIIFNIQNIANYLLDKQNYDIRGNIPNVRPPYQNMWCEFNTPYNHLNLDNFTVSHQQDLTRMGLLMVSYEATNEIHSITTIFREDKYTGPHISFARLNKCDLVGNLIPEYYSLGTTKEDLLNNAPPEILNDIINTETFVNISALLAISFMHCKNVIINTNEYDIKLQRSREKKGKLPLVKYHTLEIKPMVKILDEQGEAHTKGLKYALHICRGHFKDFRDGPGLGKGRAHGLYWWDSQVRGHIEEGITAKDYKVTQGNILPIG